MAEEGKALSVSEATALAKRKFEQIKITVIGEVSELAVKPGYANVFFTIKDEGACLYCKMWKSKYDAGTARLSIGALVQVSGRFTIWPAKGDIKFEALSLELAGEGKLRQQVAQLAENLRKEGLMDPARKKPIPAYPQRIGVVTSPRGAVVHDALRTLRRRYPLAEIVLAGVPVEGEHAAEYILKGLRCVYANKAEVILLIRGGGSFQDFMPFNDEALVRAMCKCPTPIITGIGHEPDNTIADMVADLRCSTPTAAAEAVAPDFESIRADLDAGFRRMQHTLELQLGAAQMQLQGGLAHPLFKDPYELLSNNAQKIDYLADKLQRAIPGMLQRDESQLEKCRLRLAGSLPRLLEGPSAKLQLAKQRLSASVPKHLDANSAALASMQQRLQLKGPVLTEPYRQSMQVAAAKLESLSPLAVLSRGYSITRNEQGSIINSIGQAALNSEVTVRLSDGSLSCRVEGVETID